MAESNEELERRVFCTAPADLTSADLVAYLLSRYTAEPVPPCQVCGDRLEIASMGGGRATQYACTGKEVDPNNYARWRNKPGRTIADDHYAQSRWTRYRTGDAQVLELVARFERQQQRAKAAEP